MKNRHAFYVNRMIIEESKATRRIKRQTAKMLKALQKAKTILRRQEQRAQNLELRRQVKTLKAAKRIPHLRLRNRDSYRYIQCAGTTQKSRNWTTCGQTGSYTSPGVYVSLGEFKAVEDWTPSLKPEYPRQSPVRMISSRIGSTKAKLTLTPKECWYPTYTMERGPWAALGVREQAVHFDATALPGFDYQEAARALQKAQAKAYSAEIQANEYVVEWKQVLRLLKDPFKTVMRLHRTLERWTRRDAWIFIPQRTYRKVGRGLLVSKAPTGGVLMSMRTRRTLPIEDAPDQLVQAAANRWLQYRYGIMPMVKDINKIMSLWVQPTPATGLQAAKARSMVTSGQKESEYTTWMYPWYLRFRIRHKWSESYVAKQWYDADEAPLSYRLGLHPSQMHIAIWNALPYSFVADWFVNVDDWLTANLDVPWIRLRHNCVTRVLREEITAVCVRATELSTNYDAAMDSQPVASRVILGINRQIDLPPAREPVLSRAWQSLKNAATALALIYQPLLKRK